MHTEIKKQLKEDFEKRLFDAALNNLKDANNPLRFNNFAYATRELVRHILVRLAPDKEILECSWYENETDAENGISRKQRVYYAVQGGLSNEFVNTRLGIDISKMHADLQNSFKNLSKHTHIEEETLGIEESAIKLHVEATLNTIDKFFQTIEESRKRLVSTLWETIDQSAVDAALRETIMSIDELATHHTIEEVCTDEIKITHIDSWRIWFKAVGTVSCELQWGSDSDVRKDDGLVIPQSFPFTCELWSDVNDPKNIHSEENAFHADTSSWWDGYAN